VEKAGTWDSGIGGPDGFLSAPTPRALSATVEPSPGKQVRTALDERADQIRNKKPMKSVSIPPFVVDNATLDNAERIDEAK
jgi:hypothetical protein